MIVRHLTADALGKIVTLPTLAALRRCSRGVLHDITLNASNDTSTGLYSAPPENAVVLSVDEESQIQALDRTVRLLPMRMGDAEKRTHDYHPAERKHFSPLSKLPRDRSQAR